MGCTVSCNYGTVHLQRILACNYANPFMGYVVLVNPSQNFKKALMISFWIFPG